jgi:hypothetical protein
MLRSRLAHSDLRRLTALLAAMHLLAPGGTGIGSRFALAGALPGGPLEVGGPNLGSSGVPFIWDPAAMPIQYRVDPGPMAVNPSGIVVVDNPAGLARVKSMFGTWSSVTTASLSFSNAGVLLPSGAYTGGPVAGGSNPIANFNAVLQSCDNAQQSPVVFDPNGNLLGQLGLSSAIIGVTFPCSLDSAGGHIKAAGILLNGEFQDGVSSPATGNYELTANEFNQAITHEIGHLIGLDHSQINVEVLNEHGNCTSGENSGLPVMFPFAACKARVDVGLPALSPDDTAWVSKLYAGSSYASSYGTISGTVYFSDGITQAQGVNVVARSESSPQGIAFSVVSGYRFTGNLGQTVTCQDPAHPSAATCSNLGSSFGSRDATLIGTFDIPATPGNYTVQVESINTHFRGGSSVGPLRVPIPMPGVAPALSSVNVQAGAVVILNITLQGTPSRFDAFESSELIVGDPLWLWQRRADVSGQVVAR